jgi:hypothetical protein
MRTPTLAAFLIISLAIAGIIEFLAQKSQRQGGLALTPNDDEVSPAVLFSRYGPTTVSVVYGMCWTWVDLDIRRMQPWLELSRPGGASAESSLLLDYPAEFLPFVPLKAYKRR